MGDQFLALAEGRTQPPDDDRHFGLVVDDKEAALAAARDAGVEMFGKGNDFRDPWGNFIQVVEYSADPVHEGATRCSEVWIWTESANPIARLRSCAKKVLSDRRR